MQNGNIFEFQAIAITHILAIKYNKNKKTPRKTFISTLNLIQLST